MFFRESPQLQIEPENFSEEADSTILVREGVKGTKLEGNFEKIKGQIISQSENTITVLPKSGKQTIYSKRDMVKMGQNANTNKKETNKKKPKTQERPTMPKQPFWRNRQAAQKWDNFQQRHTKSSKLRRKHYKRSRTRRKPRANNPN